MTKKRILIFAPELETQRGIEDRILENLSNLFERYGEEITIQKFASIGESLDKGARIGVGGEILVIFDKYLQIRDKRRNYLLSPPSKEEKIYLDSLEMVVTVSQNICSQEGIPYITYEGEIQRGKEGRFKRKLKEIEPNVFLKLTQNSGKNHLFFDELTPNGS